MLAIPTIYKFSSELSNFICEFLSLIQLSGKLVSKDNIPLAPLNLNCIAHKYFTLKWFLTDSKIFREINPIPSLNIYSLSSSVVLISLIYSIFYEDASNY